MGSLCHFLNPASLPREENHQSGLNASGGVRGFDVDYLCRDDAPVDADVCTGTDRAENAKGISWVVYLLGASLIIQGVAKAPRVPLSTVFVDDNCVSKARTSFYVGKIF